MLTPAMFFIVCPLLFLSGLIDAVGGGGGLISLPAYLLGSYIGSGIAAKNNIKVTRSIVLFVLALLFLKILGVF